MTPAWPMTWMAASANRIMPDAPIGFGRQDATGRIDRNPSADRGLAGLGELPALPSGAKPRFSSHIGSNQENGT